MKNSPLTTFLLGALGLSALTSLVLCWLYVGYARELRALQSQAAAIGGRQGAMNALLNDMVEYSKKNPQILPLLEAAGLRPAGTNKSAAK